MYQPLLYISFALRTNVPSYDRAPSNFHQTLTLNFLRMNLVDLGSPKIFKHHIIQVLIDFPCPDSTGKDNFYEDTMLLLQMVRDKRQKENRLKKVQFHNLNLTASIATSQPHKVVFNERSGDLSRVTWTNNGWRR